MKTREILKIKTISLENYRFFQEKIDFNFEERNVLIYGENGSGKSSLFNALQKFFKYYSNKDLAKLNIQNAQNIFVDKEVQKPKITIETNSQHIELTQNGISDDSLQIQIENTGKSKLFLTYKDIYAINAIFKEDITYKEFKELFTVLYHEDLFSTFNVFDTNVEKAFEYINTNSKELEENISILKERIEAFPIDWEDELLPIIKTAEGDEIPFIYDVAFYISDDDYFRLHTLKDGLKIYLEFYYMIGEIEGFNVSEILERYQDILDELGKYTYTADRYSEKEITEELIILDKQIEENHPKLDDLLDYLGFIDELAIPLSRCYELAASINDIINQKLNASKDKINDILEYLQTNLTIESIPAIEYIIFNNDFFYHEEVKNIVFEVSLSGRKLPNHANNLNEAKMSALNTAIYFSAVLEKKPDIPILVLDDLMISLDMSNRDKMLDFLLDKSNFDADYQILIFTHDRAFFEKAKRKFERQNDTKWKYFEMFLDVRQEGKFTIELPFVKEFAQPYGYLELAKDHFQKREYPPAANYLRKEVEKLFDDYLKIDNLDEKIKLSKLKDNFSSVNNLSKNAKKLVKVLEQFKNCEKIPAHLQNEKCKLFAEQVVSLIKEYEAIFHEFINEESETFDEAYNVLKDILHPQSHNDLTKPLFKKELEEALRIVADLHTTIEKIV